MNLNFATVFGFARLILVLLFTSFRLTKGSITLFDAEQLLLVSYIPCCLFAKHSSIFLKTLVCSISCCRSVKRPSENSMGFVFLFSGTI